jgi:hypothetical protein
MTLFWGNSRLANSTLHLSEGLKRSAKKLPACAVQSAVKVNSSCGEVGPASIKEKRDGGGIQTEPDSLKQGSLALTVPLLEDNE